MSLLAQRPLPPRCPITTTPTTSAAETRGQTLVMVAMGVTTPIPTLTRMISEEAVIPREVMVNFGIATAMVTSLEDLVARTVAVTTTTTTTAIPINPRRDQTTMEATLEATKAEIRGIVGSEDS